MDMDRSVVPQHRVPWVSIGYPAAGSATSAATSFVSSPDEPAGVTLYDQLDVDDARDDKDADNTLMQDIALQ